MRLATVEALAKKLPSERRFPRGFDIEKAVRPPRRCTLSEYLESFDVTVAVLQTYNALERAAFELCEDAAAENVLYLEIRFAPLLHIEEKLNPREVVLACLEGIERAREQHGVEARLILSALKQASTEDSMEVAQLAAQFAGKGVVAVDLAGPEKQNPPQIHREAIQLARDSGLHITIHAGEGCCPEQIKAALDLGAERIGHGVYLFQAPETEARIAKLGIPLEMCPTSNLQISGLMESYADHPIDRYAKLGIPVTINTDNRLMSNVDLTHEFEALVEAFSWSEQDVHRVIRNGVDASFAPNDVKDRLHQRVDDAFAS